MTEQELAAAIFNAGLMTREQIEAAAAERTPQRNFAQVIVAKGWLSPAQIAQFDANALPASPSQTAFNDNAFNANPFSNDVKGQTRANDVFNAPRQNQPFGAPPIPEPGGFSPAYRPAYQSSYQQAVNGTTVLIFGILGLVICQIFAPFAWYMGNQAVAAIDAGRADPAERTSANIGRILGIVGTVFLILGIAFLMLGFLASVTSVSNSSSSMPSPNFR